MTTRSSPTVGDEDVPSLSPGELKIPQMSHDVKQLRQMMESLEELYSAVLIAGTDYGPGRKGGKTVLLKPGAEKIFGLFNLTSVTRVVDESSDYKKGFFAFRIVCRGYDRASGACVVEAMGACNSREERMASSGDPFSLHNVCLKMAEKRAFVNCALRLGMASDRFTQDMEELTPTADPSTIMEILDHIVHPAFTDHERDRTRKFIKNEPEPERAIEFLEQMIHRLVKYDAKNISKQSEPDGTSLEKSEPSPPPVLPELTQDVASTDSPLSSKINQTVKVEPAPSQHNGNHGPPLVWSTVPERVQLAMCYLRAGLAVIPLKPPGLAKGAGKAPLIKDWTRFSYELPTPDHITAWWNDAPDANLGVVCGPASNLFVLDQDGEEGAETLLMAGLPPTPIVETASGRHYYFKYPTDLELTNRIKVMPGVDVRANRGQVVAPPSKHSSGVKYRWEIMPTPLARTLLDISIPYEGEVLPFATAPDWLMERLTSS